MKQASFQFGNNNIVSTGKDNNINNKVIDNCIKTQTDNNFIDNKIKKPIKIVENVYYL